MVDASMKASNMMLALSSARYSLICISKILLTLHSPKEHTLYNVSTNATQTISIYSILFNFSLLQSIKFCYLLKSHPSIGLFVVWVSFA